jgi:hypothetical protein
MAVTRVRRACSVLLGVVVLAGAVASSAAAQSLPDPNDPRVGLSAGLDDAAVASSGIDLLAHRDKPPGFFDPANPGSFAFVNSDLAFQGDDVFIGGFNGFQIWNASNPAAPVLRTAVTCPGGQGDLSVYKNLLFMSVEQTSAKIDCTTTPAADATTRFMGVRIFDISDLANPKQIAAVQTCRGSHTHTLVTSKRDKKNVYIYVQGTANVRPAAELAGCVETPAAERETEDAKPADASRWRIEVIKVPLAKPSAAAVVTESRLFSDGTRINGLQNAPTSPSHPSGIGWGPRPTTDSCHDITVYPEREIAAGACEGNGILIDIKDPANPKRIDAIADPTFAYWHGATFSNDGKTVVFTDEWGGGTSARCRAQDDLSWGANAIYDIVGGKLQFRSYFKIPPVQTTNENCVSHLPSLVPVPGRDIMIQAWYQGGTSLIDFTDSSNPKEIGYWDRGPISGTGLVLGGFWSNYWYNGSVFGSEIARGLDVFGLKPTADLSANEIAAAREVDVDRLNVQHQDKLTWRPSFAVVRSHVDQLERSGDLTGKLLDKVNAAIDKAERDADRGRELKAATRLVALGFLLHDPDYRALRSAVFDLARSL